MENTNTTLPPIFWFDDDSFVSIIKNNLPKLFREAELETMRGGKIGMEVGGLRERILISCLIKRFGKDINTNFGTTDNSKDVKVFEDVLSIKTFSNDAYGGLKVFWASDNQIVDRVIANYKPQNNLLIAQIKWGKEGGGLYYVPLSVQNEYFEKHGVSKYLKRNTGNNRGISIDKEILISMLNNPNTKRIDIEWNHNEDTIDVYERWINKIV